MGIIAVLLYSQGYLGAEFHVPLWVVLACQTAMAFGTLFGGWRIVRTMGSKITRLTPVQGFCAETGGAATLFLATWFGIPVSTMHTIGRHHRRRPSAQGVGRALGCRLQHRGGMDRHDSCSRPDGGDRLLAGRRLRIVIRRDARR